MQSRENHNVILGFNRRILITWGMIVFVFFHSAFFIPKHIITLEDNIIERLSVSLIFSAITMIISAVILYFRKGLEYSQDKLEHEINNKRKYGIIIGIVSIIFELLNIFYLEYELKKIPSVFNIKSIDLVYIVVIIFMILFIFNTYAYYKNKVENLKVINICLSLYAVFFGLMGFAIGKPIALIICYTLYSNSQYIFLKGLSNITNNTDQTISDQ